MTLESNSADSDSEEPQNREDEPQSESLTWQNIEIDENKMAALKGVIEEIVNSSEKFPLADQIIEAAKAVSKISSGINWLQNHKEDFERIIGRASILVVLLWQSYKKSKYNSLVWPPPKLKEVVDYLVETVHRVHKLMERKFNIAKRIFQGYIVRDLGKFKKYEERLDSVAEGLEKRRIKINELLLEVLDSRARHRDDADSEPPKKDEDAHRSENKGKKNLKKVRVDDDVVEGTSGRLGGSWPNKSGPTKARERLSQILEDEERIGNEPKQTRNMRRQTAPPQSPTSGSRTSINNHGSGTIYNRDVGNTYNPTLTNVANQLEPRRNISKSSNWFPISFGLKFP